MGYTNTTEIPIQKEVCRPERLIEENLYPFIGKSLEKIGFQCIQQGKAGKGKCDFKCFYNGLKLIIEVKIEDPHTEWKKLLEGVAQAWEYSKSTNAVGYIVIEYPTDVRRPLLFTPEVIEELVKQSNVNVFVLTDFWTDKIGKKDKITTPELLKKLKERADAFIIRKEKSVSPTLAVDTIQDAISRISGILREYARGTIDDLINTVVGRFDLFLSLVEEKEKKLKIAAIDLSSYLLVNQILFYHIYASLTKSESKGITDLDETKINSIFDLKEYFKKLTDINYKAIYSVDVVSALPNDDLIVENVKNVIKAIKGVRVASIKHDLIGRIYHDSLPSETRKRLATFYTKPIAAEILAGLCIDKWDGRIIDPACGSGTLLVAAYRRKVDLYKEKQGIEELSIGDVEDLHNRFVKEQIAGLDIMPFACHLTAVNLSAQNPHVRTNKLRVAVQDSLSLQNAVKSKEFKKHGIPLKPFSRTIQETLVKPEIIKQTYFSRNGEVVEAKGVPRGIGEEFSFYPSDVVIMNPPFTYRRKTPEDYRKKLKTFDKLIAKTGNDVSLWGFFLALSDDLIKEGGKIGAVIPITFAVGTDTKKIRDYFLENYRINYIVKATKDLGFSEAAAFRDILFIAEKKKAKSDHLTGIIFLKKSIKEKETSLDDAGKIVERIKRITPKKDYVYSDDDFEMYFVMQEKLHEQGNIMPFLWFSSLGRKEIIDKFLHDTLQKANDKLVLINKNWLMEGYRAWEKGLFQLIYLTRSVNESRISRASLVFDSENEKRIKANIKGINKRLIIPKKSVVYALRTITGIKKIDISNQLDFLVIEEYPDFDTVLIASKDFKKVSKDFWTRYQKRLENKGTYTAIGRRFNPYSPQTSMMAIYSKNKFYPNNAFNILVLDKVLFKKDEDFKIITLSLNSILFIVEVILYLSQATGTFPNLNHDNLKHTHILDPVKLTSDEKQPLLDLFEKLKTVEFPSIVEQLEQKFPARVELDKTILKILGFSDKEIDEWLPKVYDALVDELKAMKEVK